VPTTTNASRILAIYTGFAAVRGSWLLPGLPAPARGSLVNAGILDPHENPGPAQILGLREGWIVRRLSQYGPGQAALGSTR
jgi:hypothetical protein